MSVLPVSMELDRIGIERLPVNQELKNWLINLVDRHEEIYKLIFDRLQRLDPQDHIVNADGTLADITTKFNTLLGQLEGQDLLDDS